MQQFNTVFHTLIISLLFSISLLAQSTSNTGPGGVGNTDGTGSLCMWVDAKGLQDASQADGTDVGTWSDKSSTSDTAISNTNETCYNDPHYVDAWRNGMPAVYFDADNYEALMIDDAGTRMQPSDDATIFGIYQPAACGNGCTYGSMLMEDYGTVWDNSGYGFVTRNAGSNDFYSWYEEYSDGIQPATVTDWVNGTPNIYAMRIDDADKKVGFFENDGTETYKSTNATSGTWAANYTDGTEDADNVSIMAYTGSDPCMNNYVLEGYLPEMFMYSGEALNDCEMVIVNNYLSAKYNIGLSSADIYDGDDIGYDYHVSGIGQASDGSKHLESRGTGYVRISTTTGLANNEYLFWGLNGNNFGTQTTDLPGTVEIRYVQDWYVTEESSGGAAVDVGSIDISVMMEGDQTVSDLRLIIDTDGDGVYSEETPISGASAESNGEYKWSGVTTVVNGSKFTVGTVDFDVTPLPIEFLSFDVELEESEVLLEWITETEINNDYFTIARSTDAQNGETIFTQSGAGNSNTELYYSGIDNNPAIGVNYYKLVQTDYDGRFSTEGIRAINYVGNTQQATIKVYPNPANDNIWVELDGLNSGENIQIIITAMSGRLVYSSDQESSNLGTISENISVQHLTKGAYV
ncbi:MAG: T9SS type A sorting domain-containing protein [Flavobacteriales bacterium]|nr:T9SS type A sorting domain-containing protein [Flavobacteriales bacterium]